MVYRDPATPCWVLATKCPLLSQHLPLQPPLCLELWDHLASTSPGNAVEDELSSILPVKTAEKRLKSMWTHWLLICAGNVLLDMSRILLCILTDASCMIRLTFGSDCKARAAPLNENQVAALQSALLEKLVYLSILRWISVSWFMNECWCKRFRKELLIFLSFPGAKTWCLIVGVYITEDFSTISITALNIAWHVVSQLFAGIKKMTPPKLNWK